MKITQRQWNNIERAVLKDGQSVRSIAIKYGVDESAVRKRLKNAKTERIENVAIKLAEAERDLRALEPIERMRVRNLAEMLGDLSHTMSEVAELGMRNALKLTQMKARAIDNLEPGDNNALKEVYLLAETAIDRGDGVLERIAIMAMAPINIPALKKS